MRMNIIVHKRKNMKNLVISSLLITPILLSADVIPAMNSKGGAMVLPEGKVKMTLKHIQFERENMFNGSSEVQNRENLDATANVTLLKLNYWLSKTTTVGLIVP
jgi:hypothetical protein